MKVTIALAELASALVVVLPATTNAQTYPTKPIRMLVPYSAGGTQDMVARLIAPQLGEGLGQRVLVENRPGAGTVIAAEVVAKSAPDGHTIISTNIAHAANPFLVDKLPYDSSRDFESVILLATFPMVLVTHPSLPVHSVEDLRTFASGHPGRLNYASSGTGGAGHLSMELFRNATKMDMVRVAYKGGSQALAAVVGGEVPITFIPVPLALANAKAGKLRVIAVSSSKRIPTLPDTRTVAESGVAGFAFHEWQAIFARRGTARSIVAKLNNEIDKVLAMPEIKDRIAAAGGNVVGGAPERLDAHVKEEFARWSAVFTKPGVSIAQ